MEFPKDYVVFDFETTGLSRSEGARVLEVGALKVKGGVQEQFECLIKGQVVPAKITELTSITQEMADTQGIDLREAFDKFTAFIEDLPLIGHNIIKFDFKFLSQWALDAGMTGLSIIEAERRWSRRCVDTAALFKAKELGRIHNPEIEDHIVFMTGILQTPVKGLKFNVGHCCSSLGIPNVDGQHRAMADILLTNEIYKKLCLI